jgi:hypothetical protein
MTKVIVAFGYFDNAPKITGIRNTVRPGRKLNPLLELVIFSNAEGGSRILQSKMCLQYYTPVRSVVANVIK